MCTSFPKMVRVFSQIKIPNYYELLIFKSKTMGFAPDFLASLWSPTPSTEKGLKNERLILQKKVCQNPFILLSDPLTPFGWKAETAEYLECWNPELLEKC